MLPKQHKFTSPAEFSRTIKRGRRAGTRTVVVHLVDRSTGPDAEIAHQGGPRVGLIVSKAVGNAVIRHRTSRRLRHVCAGLFGLMPATTDLVVRALPPAGAASTADLERDIRKALRKLGVAGA
ncbi:ribonuclease P protein component [Corynebacterium marinum]|uniref:Ribonuclease P protein component n=1 Tax=Corynebacterium marinum TaxID=349751 RepID=A0A847HB89_9CORY|nr:ribonuclease P protein component [Corynebacterium marinum]NLF90646.1 ribonuclease P protein component [Corynebacterium marinum]GGO13113.1 ribonuclease P protein component [Corynebacterium marinum]